MKRKLQERREAYGYTQRSFAEKLGVSFRTYQNIEYKPRMPRKPLMLAIMETLETESIHIFDFEEKKIKGQVDKNVLNYMNQLSEKEFTLDVLPKIRKAIKLEIKDRKEKEIEINNRSRKGKWEIYKRVSEIAKKELDSNITAKDVQLFRNCVRNEYTDRTGKTTWSIPAMREFYGFNKVTGY